MPEISEHHRSELQEALTQFMIEHPYDSCRSVLQFISHLESAGISPHIIETTSIAKLQEIFKSYQVDSNMSNDNDNGGSCVEQALGLQTILTDKGYPAYCCPVVLPDSLRQGNPLEYGHLAVVIPFLQGTDKGYILFDPGLSLPTPVVLTAEQPVTISPWENSPVRQEWTFTLEAGSPPRVYCDVFIPNSEGGGRSRFDIGLQCHNPQDTLSRIAAFNRRPRMASRNAAGEYISQCAVERGRKGTLVFVDHGNKRGRVPAGQIDDVRKLITPHLAQSLLPHVPDSEKQQRLIQNTLKIALWMPLLHQTAQDTLSSYMHHAPAVTV